MKSLKGFLNESSLSRVWSQMQKHDAGLMSAFRYAPECGTGTPYSKRENLSRHHELMVKLRKKGYGITAVKGVYIENFGSKDAKEVVESVFLIVDINNTGTLERDMRLLGKMYDQDSILFITKGGKTGQLIGTNHCPNGYPGYGKKINLKNPVFGQGGQFQTRVNGRPFILKEDVTGFFSKYAKYLIDTGHIPV